MAVEKKVGEVDSDFYRPLFIWLGMMGEYLGDEICADS
jgi:hypothetical protein